MDVAHLATDVSRPHPPPTGGRGHTDTYTYIFYIHTYIHTYMLTCRLTCIPTYRHTDLRTHIHTDIHTDLSYSLTPTHPQGGSGDWSYTGGSCALAPPPPRDHHYSWTWNPYPFGGRRGGELAELYHIYIHIYIYI